MNKKIEQVFRDIKSVKIQGATAVAVAVCRALKNYAKQAVARSKKEFIEKISSVGCFLAEARDTEPMAANAVKFIIFQLKKSKAVDLKELKKVLEEAADYFLDLVEKNQAKIVKVGEKQISFGDKVFTHCHSSTVIKVLIAARRNKKRFEVFQTETRPLYQGHKTAKELLSANIKNTLVVDSAAPYLISKISGPRFQIDKLVIGCDAIARDGSCVNKVGSFSLALAAFLNKIPIYVATQSLKINEDAKNLKAIKIEQRLAREVWDKAPKDLRIYNPAFDKVPAELITGYICEFGVVKPECLMKNIKENYSWL